MKHLIAFLKEEEGLTIVEYAIAGGLVAAGVALTFGQLGTKVKGVIEFLRDQIPAL